MSRMGQYVFELEEDAREMSFEAFVLKHGKYNASYWHAEHESPGCWDKYIPEYDEYEDYESTRDS